MAQPEHCPLEIYAIMRDCWMRQPESRPHFQTLAEHLGKILEKNITKVCLFVCLIVCFYIYIYIYIYSLTWTFIRWVFHFFPSTSCGSASRDHFFQNASTIL